MKKQLRNYVSGLTHVIERGDYDTRSSHGNYVSGLTHVIERGDYNKRSSHGIPFPTVQNQDNMSKYLNILFSVGVFLRVLDLNPVPLGLDKRKKITPISFMVLRKCCALVMEIRP